MSQVQPLVKSFVAFLDTCFAMSDLVRKEDDSEVTIVKSIEQDIETCEGLKIAT